MKYCVGCRFFLDNSSSTEFGRCGHDAAKDEQDAKRFISRAFDIPAPYKFAKICREYGPCGADAKLFEAADLSETSVAELEEMGGMK